MIGKERFEKLIAFIESEVNRKDFFRPWKEILESASTKMGISTGNLSAAFSFLTDYLLRNYIIDRKLMASYRYLIENKKPSIFHAVEISGYDNQSSFTKRFGEKFGITPKKAITEKNADLLEPALTWGDTTPPEPVEEELPEEKMTEETIIDFTQYSRFKQLFDLQNIYGFSDIQCGVINEFSLSHNYPLDESFEYFDYMTIPYDKYDKEELISNGIDNEEAYWTWRKEDYENPDYIYLFFEKKVKNDMFFLIDLDCEVRDLSDAEIIILSSTYGSWIPRSQAIRAAHFFEKKTGGVFSRELIDYYIEYLFSEPDFESAFEAADLQNYLNEAIDENDSYYSYEKPYDDSAAQYDIEWEDNHLAEFTAVPSYSDDRPDFDDYDSKDNEYDEDDDDLFREGEDIIENDWEKDDYFENFDEQGNENDF